MGIPDPKMAQSTTHLSFQCAPFLVAFFSGLANDYKVIYVARPDKEMAYLQWRSSVGAMRSGQTSLRGRSQKQLRAAIHARNVLIFCRGLIFKISPSSSAFLLLPMICTGAVIIQREGHYAASAPQFHLCCVLSQLDIINQLIRCSLSFLLEFSILRSIFHIERCFELPMYINHRKKNE